MNQDKDYTWVGIFVVFLTVLAVTTFFWLTATRHDRPYNTYIVYLSEGVSGLNKESEVRFNGVPVGYVALIALDKDNPRLVKLTLRIAEGTPVTTSTVASLNMTGITGATYIELRAKTKKAPLLKTLPGEPYPVINESPSLMMTLNQMVPHIVDAVNNISQGLSQLLTKKNSEAVAKTLENTRVFTQALMSKSNELSETIVALHKTMNNAKLASVDLPQSMQLLKKALRQMTVAADQVAKAGRHVSKTAQSSDVMVQNFTQQMMPSMQQVLFRLNRVLGNLQQVSEKLNRNPSILIRGEAPSSPGPGEQHD